jgi:predicted deacylase
MRASLAEVDKAHGATLNFYEFGQGKPRVLITGAVHGDEVVGTYAIQNAISGFDRRTIKGSVLFLPVANPLAYRCRERASPVDRVDLNRVFPGNEEGSVSERLANRIWKEATKADYILDLHGAGLNCIPYILCLHREFNFVRKYVRKLGVPTVVESSGLRGQLFIEASHRKIPAAVIEAGSHHGVFLTDHAEQLRSTILGLLASLGMIEESVTTTKQRFFGKILNTKAKEEDFFSPRVKPGTIVKKRDSLGFLSRTGKKVLSQHNGIITSIQMPGVVFPGDSIANIAEET